MATKDLMHFSSDSSSDEDGHFHKFSKMPVKRMAIIDGANVMFACDGMALNNYEDHSGAGRSEIKPDALGILVMVRPLLAEGYDLQIIVPSSYMSDRKTKNVFILKVLQLRGMVTVIDDGSHDDLVILEFAKNLGGFVISNDRFRDHAGIEGLKHTIRTRAVGFNFRRVTLDEVGKDFIADRSNHYFTGISLTLRPYKKAMFAERIDPSFGVAFAQRALRSESASRITMSEIDILHDYFQQEFCFFNGVKPPRLDYYDPEDAPLPSEYFKFRQMYSEHQKRHS